MGGRWVVQLQFLYVSYILKQLNSQWLFFLNHFILGQEDNPYAKQNYEKYLSALKNSGLVSVEEKALPASAEAPTVEEEATGALGSSGEAPPLPTFG